MPEIKPQHIVGDLDRSDSLQHITDSINQMELSSVYLKGEDSMYQFVAFQPHVNSLLLHNFQLIPSDSISNSSAYQYGFDATPRVVTMEKTAAIQSILLVSLLLTTIAVGVGYRYFEQMLSNIHKVKTRLDFSFDNSYVGFELKAILTLQAVLLESMVALVLVKELFYSDGQEAKLLTGILYFGLVFGVYHVFRIVSISLFGSVFGESRSLNTYISEYFSFLSLWGVLLFPIAISLLFFHLPPIWVAILLALPAILGRILYIGKGIKIFLVQKRSIFYIILYLCALEIVPLIALFQVLVFTYSFS